MYIIIIIKMLDKSGKIKSTYTEKEYMAKKNITCSSNNLIYCITCKKYKMQYVSQTGESIKKRFEGHKGNIGWKNLAEDTGRHFNLKNHSGFSDIRVSILDFISLHPKSKEGLNMRLQVEFD